MQIYSSRAFQQYQECSKRSCDMGDLNLTNKTKQNKHHGFIDRYEGYVQKSSNDISSDLNYNI
jgi:hypothetical protein